MVTFDELKRLVAETVALERQLRSKPDFRGNSCRLYLKLRKAKDLLNSVPSDDAPAQAFCTNVKPLIEKRLSTMEENNEYNPISVAIHEKTELDLFVLDKHLTSEDFHVRLDAVAACGELDYKAALPKLLELLDKEEHPWVISKLTKVIGPIGGARVIDKLLPYLEHQDDRIRANTVEGLDLVDSEDKYPHLMRMLDDKSNRVRANALKALRSLGGAKFIELIKKMINSSKVDTRKSVLFVLQSMRNTFARDSLITLLNDRDLAIQMDAAKMLKRFLDLTVVEALTEVIVDTESKKLKDCCLDALRGIREAAPEELKSKIDGLIKKAITPAAPKPAPSKASTNISIDEDEVVEIIADDEPKTPPRILPVTDSPAPEEGSDEDLLAELAEFSRPGDIAPSRVAEVAKKRVHKDDPNTRSNPGGTPDAVKKTLARLHAILSKLEPRLKMEAEKLVMKGKIKNEAHIKQWLDRKKNKR